MNNLNSVIEGILIFLKGKKISYTLILTIFSSFMSLFLGKLNIDLYFFPLFSIIAICFFIYETYKIISNVLTFSILLLLLTVLFPLSHFFIYKHNKTNYFFDKDYLTLKANNSAQESIYHINQFYLKDFLRLNQDSILKKDINELSKENIIILNNYFLKFEAHLIKNPRHPGDLQLVLSLYQNSGKKLGIMNIEGIKTIEEVILREISFSIVIEEMYKRPEDYIIVNDFWFESITGFTFGHIKPSSNISIAIRSFQLIVAFLFLAMVNNTLRASGKFVLEKSKSDQTNNK